MITNIVFCASMLFSSPGQLGWTLEIKNCDNNPYDVVPETPDLSVPCPAYTVLDLECVAEARSVYEGQMEALYSSAAADFESFCDLAHAEAQSCTTALDNCYAQAFTLEEQRACFQQFDFCTDSILNDWLDNYRFLMDYVKQQSDAYYDQYLAAALECCVEFHNANMTAMTAPLAGNICDNNPFHEPFEIGDYSQYDDCDEGYSPNEECAKEILDKLVEDINELNNAMAPLYDAICSDYQDAVNTCIADYNNCILAGGTPSSCAASQAVCLDHATTQRRNEISALFTLYRDAARDLITDAAHALLECCEEDQESVAFKEKKQDIINALYLKTAVTTDPNQVCDENPYETAPGLPTGAINCPPGYGYPNQECIDKAEDEYKEAVEEIAGNASDSFNALCGAWEAGSQSCVDSYLACRAGGTPQQVCYDNYLTCYNSALSMFEFGMSTLEAETSALYTQATNAYWAALEECCTPPEE